jgi:hypothetical protein
MRWSSPVELSWAFDNDSNGDGRYVASVNMSAEDEPDRLLYLELTPDRARELARCLIERASDADVENAVDGTK